MIKAMATLALAGAVWLVLTAGNDGWPLSFSYWLGAALMGAATLAATHRMLGWGGANVAPRLVLLAHRALAAPGGWTRLTLKLALASADPGKPVLVRFRTRIAGEDARAAFGHGLCAGPGLALVDAQGDSVLIHVLDENDAAIDRRIGAVEAAAEAQP